MIPSWFNWFTPLAILALAFLIGLCLRGLVLPRFLKRLHARYQQEGIAIPFPTRAVHLTNRP